MADTKIADNTTNMGATTAVRTPDGVLEVVGGNTNKPIFVARPADNTTDSGSVSTTSANTSFIIRNNGNVGIGTAAPQNTLHIGTALVAGTAGIRTPLVNAAALSTDANGNIVATVGATVSFGDIKTGIQSTDHNGWVKLDGRLKSTLTATQQTQATSLGIGTNLPDATNAYLVQNGAALGSVSGSNTKTIAQNQLPNVTLSGTAASAGAHQHFATGSGWGDFTANPVGNFGWVFANGGNQGSNPFSYDGAYYAGTADAGATSSNGAHSHTIATSSINGGVAQQSFSVQPMSLSVNT